MKFRFRKPGQAPGVEGLENAETEAALRIALAEPEAAGEDESYRRLMAVIADDMRLRQPAPSPSVWTPWSWVPGFSAACTVAILLTAAYIAGMDKGREMAEQLAYSPPPAARPADSVIPRDKYQAEIPPPAAPPASPVKPEAPRLSVSETRPSPMNYMGSFLMEGLSSEQREFLRIYQAQAKEGNWDVAAGTLEDMADVDLDSEMAINALHGAAVIHQNRLKDDTSALRLYQREADVILKHLEASPTPERRAALQAQLDHARTAISALKAPPAP